MSAAWRLCREPRRISTSFRSSCKQTSTRYARVQSTRNFSTSLPGSKRYVETFHPQRFLALSVVEKETGPRKTSNHFRLECPIGQPFTLLTFRFRGALVAFQSVQIAWRAAGAEVAGSS